MSRSYRKGYVPHYRADKWYRRQYSRSFRQKIKSILRSQNEDFLDKIVLKGKDFGCKFADQWSWPSDGYGGAFEWDSIEFFKKFNTEMKEHYRYRTRHSVWEEYSYYRNSMTAKPTWRAVYDIPTGKRKVAHNDIYIDVNTNHLKTDHEVVWEGTFERVEKLFDHQPLESEIPDGVKLVLVRRIKRLSQPNNDGSLIEFLFHRNLIPLDFDSETELISWLLNNENKIVKSWEKVNISK